MLNNNIATMIILYIGSLVIELVLTKILEPYIPERKKLISNIKKFLLLPARYILPTLTIVVLMTGDVVVDKTFVFSIASGFTVLGISIVLDLVYKNTKNIARLYEAIEELQKHIANSRGGVLDGQQKTLEIIKNLADVVAQKKDKKNKKE